MQGELDAKSKDTLRDRHGKPKKKMLENPQNSSDYFSFGLHFDVVRVVQSYIKL